MDVFPGATHIEDAQGDGYDVAIVGLPNDMTVTGPDGQREAPRAIRRAGDWPDDWTTLRLLDYGDVQAPFGIVGALPFTVVIGGDNYVSLGAISSTVRQPVVVHLDAHIDADNTEQPDHGGWVYDLLESDQAQFVYTFGVRGFSTNQAHRKQQVHGCVEPLRLAEHVRRKSGRSPLWFSLDIDVVDPAFAPGTGFPEPGGYTSREILSICTYIGANPLLIGMDITEVLPAEDVGNATSALAQRCIMAVLKSREVSISARRDVADCS